MHSPATACPGDTHQALALGTQRLTAQPGHIHFSPGVPPGRGISSGRGREGRGAAWELREQGPWGDREGLTGPWVVWG